MATQKPSKTKASSSSRKAGRHPAKRKVVNSSKPVVFRRDGELRALWDRGGPPLAEALPAVAYSGGAAASAAGQARPFDQGQRAARRLRTEREASAEDRAERRAQAKAAKTARRSCKKPALATIGEAVEYCRTLVEKQLRARGRAAPGDEHAHLRRRAGAQGDRGCCCPTPRSATSFCAAYAAAQGEEAALALACRRTTSCDRRTRGSCAPPASPTTARTWPTSRRGRRPTTRSLARATTPGVYQREYRVVPRTPPRLADNLPYDLENIEPSQFVYMGVLRVPKRSRVGKAAGLRDQTEAA